MEAHGQGGVRSRCGRPADPAASGRKAAAAAAGALRVRIADHELRAVQALAVIDFGAHQVLQAERIDQQGDAVGLYGEVVLALLLVELEAVLEAGTTATLDVDAQLEPGIAFLGDQFAHLRGRSRGEVERGFELLVAGIHAVTVRAMAARFNLSARVTDAATQVQPATATSSGACNGTTVESAWPWSA